MFYVVYQKEFGLYKTFSTMTDALLFAKGCNGRIGRFSS